MRRTVDKDGNWRAFRHRNFRILYPANALSNIGTWAQRVAQDWLVLELTDNNGAALGLVTAVQFAPVLLFSLHGGKMADRVNKRKLLIWTNAVAGLASLVIGILVITKVIELWHVFVGAAVLGISTAIDAPIRQAFTSEIVGHSDVANAVSLNSANFNAGRLVGPALSGFLIAHFSTGPSFIVNATTYLFVIAALVAMREKDFFILKKEETLGTIREGIRYAMARPDLYVVMALVFFAATFGLNFQIFNALMATKEFGKGPASYGLLGTFIAVGSLTGALLSARLERFRNTRYIIKLGIVFSFSVMVLSIAPSYIWYSLWLPICGITALTMLISANSYVQTHSDPAVRGRVMGIYLLIFMGGTPFGSLLIGWMTETIGVRETIAGCGGISLLAAVVIWAIFKDRVEEPADLRVSAVLN
ncbi:MAG: MFS transporter [Candidatus Planktophila sp.]|nr:MFS transporter [Candidatus Planktophila sp.]